MNLNEKPIREKYKEFYGNNLEQMELLIKDKRVPLTIKQIIERRLNSNQSDWKDNYFDSCDAIFYGDDGKFKIIRDSKVLKEMTNKTKLVNGAIPMTKKKYDKLDLPEFSQESTKEAVWKYLLDKLYDDYIKMLDYCPHIYFNKMDKYCIRVVYVDRLEYGSGLYGWGDLDSAYGRLVGVASEMLKEKK